MVFFGNEDFVKLCFVEGKPYCCRETLQLLNGSLFLSINIAKNQ